MTESIWPMLKYRATPVVTARGERFDSDAEARRCGELLLLQREGAIRELRRQVEFELIPAQIDSTGQTACAVSHTVDFVYEEVGANGNWSLVVEDVKGVRTEADSIKRALMLRVHGIDIRQVQG
jgi:hypothetical protein